MRRAFLLCLGLWACDGASPDQGLRAWLRVDGAQFYPDDIRESGGPSVVALDNPSNQIFPGQRGKRVSGTLDATATAVALLLEGDRGFWIVPAALPDVQVPGLPTFNVALSFSPELPLRSYTLLAHAIDDDGNFGPPTSATLEAREPVPDGALVVSLSWDTEADLDLHVVLPNGVEVWSRNINSVEPPAPGIPPDPNAWRQGAVLDFDSNAGCEIDGRRRENVIFANAAPAGEYLVRVDTPSLCGESSARWRVDVYANDVRIAGAEGVSTEIDTRDALAFGSGVLAVEFTRP